MASVWVQGRRRCCSLVSRGDVKINTEDRNWGTPSRAPSLFRFRSFEQRPPKKVISLLLCHWGRRRGPNVLSSALHVRWPKTVIVFKLHRCEKIIPACLKFPTLSAARQLGQPMHSQSANFGKFKLHCRNLAGIILHDSVLTVWQMS